MKHLSSKAVAVVCLVVGLSAVGSVVYGQEVAVVTTNFDSGPGSLREAVEQANSDGGPTIITFDPSLAGQTIVLQEPLSLEQDGTTIDGDSNGDCLPDVELTGFDDNSWTGIWIRSSFNVIRGLVINGFNGSAIYMSGGNPQQTVTGNVVECNFLGTDRTGSVAVPNSFGIRLEGFENRIGGPAATSRNLISGNWWGGILIGEAQGGNVVEGNLIGTDLSGSNPLGNGYFGIQIWGQDGNRIGPNNVIAFNQGNGILVSDALRYDFPDFTNVTPDRVRLFPLPDFSGDCGTPFESSDGIVPVDGDGQPFSEYFGARLTGTVSVGVAGEYTFEMEGRDHWLVVDAETIRESGCCDDSTPSPVVFLEAGDHPVEFGFVQETGPWSAALGVSGPGAALFSTNGSAASCPLNQSGLCGELFHLHLTSERNTITRNSIHDNGQLGIEIPVCEGYGPTPNDPGDGDEGPNGALNFPELMGFTELGGGSFEFVGTAPPDSIVEIFAAAVDESGHGEGKEYLDSVTADLNGDFSAVMTLPSGFFAITATATDSDGNTSEFSRNLSLGPNEISVQNANPDGPGSLRDAIDASNADGVPTIITFEGLPAGSTIQLQSELPALTDSETTIDGDFDDDCMPDIALDGSAVGGTGLQIFSSSNLVQGLVIHSFGNDGVTIAPWAGFPADDNVLECNFIGTDPSGTMEMPNGNAGVSIHSQAADNRIGGPVASSRNVISANGGDGVSLWNVGGTRVEGNYIGTDLSGTIALGNQAQGIFIAGDGVDNHLGPDNVIAFNLGSGVAIQDSLADDWWDFDSHVADYVGVFPLIDLSADEECSRIENSDGIVPDDGSGGFIEYYSARFTGTVYVGAPGDYTFELPDFNGGFNLRVDGNGVLDGGSTIWTGHLDAGAHSLELWYFLHHHPGRLKLDIFGDGAVSLSTDGNNGGCSAGQSGLCGEFYQRPALARRNTVTQNSIFDNQGLGIDLLTCGQWGSVTSNDPGDGDDGPNTLLNFPEFTGFTDHGGGSFTVDGTAPPDSRVEIFGADADPSGHGEGKEYLDFVIADPSGSFSITIGLQAGAYAFTATATDPDGNTSEFSSNLALRPNEIVVGTTNNDGPGSLRESFEAANDDGVPTIITFDPSVNGAVIYLDDPLPDLWDDETTIDGDLNGDCVPDVEIRRNGLDWAAGVALGSSNNVVRGLAINGFASAFEIMGSSGNVIECNYAGLDLDGNPVGNQDTGINLQAGSSNNQIGPGNRVAYNGRGVLVSDGGTDDYPEFTGLTPDASEIFPTISFQDSEYPFRHANGVTLVDNDGHTFNDDFGVRVTTSLQVDVPGDYTLEFTDLDDGGRVVVDGQVVLDDCCGTQSTQVYLEAGAHDLEVDFVEGCGWANLQFAITGPAATTFSTGGEPGVLAEFFQMRIPTEGNTITRNSVFDNYQKGIALSRCGGTWVNDPGDVDLGPNTWLNFPELGWFTELGGNEFTVHGTATPESTVEFFAAAPDESGRGEGKQYLGSVAAEPNGDFAAMILVPAEYLAITATATDGEGNTSEFSKNLGLRPNEISVANSDPDGPGSLWEALDEADRDGTSTVITFTPGITGQKITLHQPLPGLWEGGTTIDADFNADCIPDVEISGEQLGDYYNGLDIGSSNNVVRGLAITNFTGSGMQISDASGNIVECNYVGVDLAGEAAGNQGEAIQLNWDANENRIGPGNVVAHNGQGLTVRDGWTDDYPNFAGLAPDASGIYPTIDFTDDCSGYFHYSDGELVLDGEGRPFRDTIGARFTAVLTVEAPGDYLFEIEELRDNARLKIDDLTVLDEGCCDYRSTTVSLAQGNHDLELAFTDGGMARVKLDVSGPGAASFSAGGEYGVFAEFFKMRVPSERNTITQSSFYDNGGQAIAFGFCGYVENDPGDLDDGPNTLLNHPDFTTREDLGGSLYRVSGTATPSSTVEIFAAAPDHPHGPGGGQEYLTSVTADPSGDFTVDMTLPLGYYSVTATATDADGNTSQFSSYLGLRPNEISVENTDPYGPGSLQDAIDTANEDGGPSVITFDGLEPGSTIELDDTLHIYDDETTVDGDLDGDCWPDIELSGEFTNGWSAIRVESSNNVIRGLVINRFPGVGVNISGWGGQPATGNVVECNFIGTDPSGTIAMGNQSGVYLDGAEAFGNRIGGPAAASRNLLSGNYDAGVYIWADGNIVEGNLIGSDITGTQPLGNGNEPVAIEGASGNRIGPDNVIAFNGRGVGVADSLDWRYPDFDGLTAAASGVFETIEFSGDCSPFTSAGGLVPTDESGNPFVQNFGALFTGTLDVSGGDYTFELVEIDGLGSVTVDGETILEEWCCGPYESTLALEPGSHHLEVAYLHFDSNARLTFDVTGPGTVSRSTDQNTGGCSESQAGLCGEFFQLRLPAERNTITANSIFGNEGRGINLPGCQGESVPNDPGDADTGPNGFMNFPELVSALADAGATVVVGSLDTPSAELSTIEFFANESADPSGFGEGQTGLGSLRPDELGAFSVNLPEVPVGQWITATATDQWGNTSEFSAALRVSEIVLWATALYASPQSSTSVLLTWTDPGYDETGFRIERSLDGESWTEVASAEPDDTSFLDETLSPATLYYYRVIAFTDVVDERPSNIAAAATFPAAAAKVCHQQVSAMHRGARVATPAFNGQHWAVVWMERNGAYDELYFQLFDGDGTPAASSVRLTESDSITQAPTLRWNGSSFGLVYGEHMRGPQGELRGNTKFMRLDADGQPIRKEIVIDAGQLGSIPNQFDEALVWDGTHWGFIVHRASDYPASDVGELEFYRLSEDGEIVLGPVRLTNTPEFENDAAAAWNGNEYGLAWAEIGDASTRVLFQRMQSDGTLVDTGVVVGETTGGYTAGVSIAWDGSAWAVVWSESQNDGSEAVLLRRFDPLGVPLGPEARISDDYDQDLGPGVPVYDEYPQLVVKPNGYAIYTLTYALSPNAWEMARLTADAAGERVGARTFVSDHDGLNSLWNRVATDGANDFLSYNESRSGTQEIAAVVVGPAGSVLGGPVELTSGHDPGVPATWTAGANQPQVAAVAGGFAALWRDVLGGGQIHASIFDSSGALSATRFPLSGAAVVGGPVAVGVGASFAVAWTDEATNQITFDRYDATGASLLGEITLDGGGTPDAIAFSGEVYGVAWGEGGPGILLQTVTADGSITGPPVEIEGFGNQLVQMQWTGAGWAIVARSWPDLYYALVDSDGAFLVMPTPITNTSSPPRWTGLAWSGDEVGVVWEEDRDGNGQREIWFKVLGLDGSAAFDEVELWSNGRTPSVYWQDGAFHSVFRSFSIDPAGNREATILPDGTITGNRPISSHHGLGHAASNGANAGFLYIHRAEAYFETTACLEDTSPPPAPSVSAFFDGSKVSLVWSAVTDAESAIIGYNLYRDGALIAENFATTFSFDDYGVVPDALYVYELRAVNGAWLESTGGAGIETVATAETVEGVGGLLEEISTEVFTQVIEGILADPEIPDEIAADIQASLDDLIGNNGGLAANGAADKLEKANIVAALSMMRHAVEELQTAGAQGYDTSDLQSLVVSFARLSVVTVIRIEAETLGDAHPDIVMARDLVEQGDTQGDAGDDLGAIDRFKDAVQALP